MNFWQEVLQKVESKVNRHSYETWFRPTQLLFETGDTVGVLVPNDHFRNWLNKHYSGVLNESLDELERPDIHIVFEIDREDEDEAGNEEDDQPLDHAQQSGHDSSQPLASKSKRVPHFGSKSPAPEPPRVSARYRFENFVVGASNQFAHAAAKAVAEAPSRAYNPLFIYGGVGLGKTHLLHAIGHQILRQTPDAKLVYTSAEKFMNDLINAIRYDRILDFRASTRSYDVLLVDDIQFIAGKERTQEEFFHTFNALYEAQKQIVITSDAPPRAIPTLEERLRSRFEWGLTADIQAPDLETKVAILQKKAENENIQLPHDVTMYIASRIKSNIRELEGSLIRLMAYASLTGREVDVPLTKHVLRDLLPDDQKPLSLEAILSFVADHYNLKPSDLKTRNNAKSIALPRQISMYLAKQLTKHSLPDIGRAFGGKHHSTVIHSVRKIDTLCRTDAEFDRLVQGFLQSLK